jgi:uncharacterized protein
VLRVRDPIHNYILLDDLGADLVDLPRVQRLRRIHQLGTGNLVYPGANHTRFEHSLGAWHLAGRAAAGLGLADSDAGAVQAAALLHDVGHGPFSHTSDPLYRDYLGKAHEDVAVEALQKGTFSEVLARHGVDPRQVADLVRGQGRLGSLVSGDVDVDRMDYLVRDSHYTGVHIGVDLERLVQDLVPTPQGVAIRASSLTAAEMLLVTRAQMYAAVYLHRTCRVGERMLERAFRLALDAGEIRPEQLPTMDDAAATMLLRHSKTDAWRLMLWVDQRKLLKVVAEEPLAAFAEDAVVELAASTKRQQALEQEIAAGLACPATEVIVDAPEPPSLPEHRARVALEDGRVVDLDEVSGLVRGMDHAQRDHWRLRVMVPASKRDAAPAKAGPILERHLG